MRSRVLRILPTLPALLYTVSVAAQTAPPPEPPTISLSQARASLANTVRQSCLIEYQNPNLNAQLLSIGWEIEPFCRCVEARITATLGDEVTRDAWLWLARTQNALKTPADLAALSNVPEVAEYIKQAKNARGHCIYIKMRR